MVNRNEIPNLIMKPDAVTHFDGQKHHQQRTHFSLLWTFLGFGVRFTLKFEALSKSCLHIGERKALR